jgi:hypothetical protein
MSDKQPIIIRRGTFVCTLYDVGNLMELPLANLRKLWKIMFDAADENTDTIAAIRDWLPANLTETGKQLRAEQCSLTLSGQQVETQRRTVAAFGTMATKEQKDALTLAQRAFRKAEKRMTIAKAAQIKARKLQSIFNEMAQRAGF